MLAPELELELALGGEDAPRMAFDEKVWCVALGGVAQVLVERVLPVLGDAVVSGVLGAFLGVFLVACQFQ